jgi:hypothetical protein
VRALEAADWKKWAGSGGVCEFKYQPEGWNRRRRFVAVRYAVEQEASDQYQLFSTEGWKYRVFVTNRGEDKRTICRQYDGRATAENYIKEGCNDAGFGAQPEPGQSELSADGHPGQQLDRWLQLMALGNRRLSAPPVKDRAPAPGVCSSQAGGAQGRSWVRFSCYGEQDRFTADGRAAAGTSKGHHTSVGGSSTASFQLTAALWTAWFLRFHPCINPD